MEECSLMPFNPGQSQLLDPNIKTKLNSPLAWHSVSHDNLHDRCRTPKEVSCNTFVDLFFSCTSQPGKCHDPSQTADSNCFTLWHLYCQPLKVQCHKIDRQKVSCSCSVGTIILLNCFIYSEIGKYILSSLLLQVVNMIVIITIPLLCFRQHLPLNISKQ